MTPQAIVVHHSFTPKDIEASKAEASFEKTHKERGFPLSKLGWHIGYHYVIYGDGEIRQYRNQTEAGAHTKEQGMNFKSIGICLSGNFDIEKPNSAQTSALVQLMLTLTKKFNIKPEQVYPHRKFAPYKSCYGKLLADDWAKKLITNKQSMIYRAKQGSVHGILIDNEESSVFIKAKDPNSYKNLGENYGLKTINDDGTFLPVEKEIISN